MKTPSFATTANSNGQHLYALATFLKCSYQFTHKQLGYAVSAVGFGKSRERRRIEAIKSINLGSFSPRGSHG
jgi:hypothetical protein